MLYSIVMFKTISSLKKAQEHLKIRLRTTLIEFAYFMGKYSDINVCCHITKQSKICFQNICKTGYVLFLNCKRLFKNKKFDIFPFWKKSWNNFSHYKGLQESFYILQTQNESWMILDLLHFMRMWKFSLSVLTIKLTFLFEALIV